MARRPRQGLRGRHPVQMLDAVFNPTHLGRLRTVQVTSGIFLCGRSRASGVDSEGEVGQMLEARPRPPTGRKGLGRVSEQFEEERGGVLWTMP